MKNTFVSKASKAERRTYVQSSLLAAAIGCVAYALICISLGWKVGLAVFLLHFYVNLEREIRKYKEEIESR